VIDLRTRLVALVLGVALLLFIIELVRRRKLKEEYSVLWVTTSLVMLVVAVWFTPLEWLTDLLGGVAPTSTLFFLGFVFVFFVLLHFSLRVSALERRLVALVQEIALMNAQQAAAREPGDVPDPPPPPAPPAPRTEPRTAVVIPCFNDGTYPREAVASIQEDEPVEVVVVDDGSTDPATLACLDELERSGVTVVHQDNAGPGVARTTGFSTSSAPYVFVLDADDLMEPGVLGQMADMLDRRPEIGFVWGDYVLFGAQRGAYRSPEKWLPWTLTYVNPYPVCSMFRREVLERAEGWQGRGYEDWDLWVRLAALGIEGASAGRTVYRRRLIEAHGRHLQTLRSRHRELYAELRQRNAAFFARRDELRASERPSLVKRLMYPVLFGHRRVIPFRVELALQRAMLRLGTGLPR